MSDSDAPKPPEHYRRFVEAHPGVAEAYRQLGAAVREAGPLSDREIALVKLALAVGADREGGTHAHVRKATAAGVEAEALRQVALLAIPTIGFPASMAALSWIDDSLE